MKLRTTLLTVAATILLNEVLAQSTIIDRTSPNNASAQLFFFDRTSNNVTDRNWKIATLPASTTSTGDKILIELFGGHHGSSGTFQQSIHMGNRNGFNGYLRSTHGDPYSSVRVRAYQQTSGSIDVYLSLLANGWKGASVRIYEGSGIVSVGPTIYENPVDVGASPPGTLVFDSYSNIPGFTIRNNGNMGIGVTNPGARLDIMTPGVSGGESLLRMKVSDATSDYLNIMNATGATNQLIPNVYGYHASDERQALYLTGAIPSSQDFGSQPLMVFDSRIHGTGPVANRPLFAWDSYGNRKMVMKANGYVGIGTTSPDMTLTVKGHMNVGGDANGTIKTRHVNGKSNVSTAYGNLYLNYHTSHPVIVGTQANQAELIVYGKLGVGTNNPTEKLTVAGTAYAQEVKVEIDAGTGPDYVFEPDYNLPSLESIEKFIQSEKHLPDIPTAKEMEEDGVRLGEMNMLLLKKMEEMTLHVIKMNKEIEALREENRKLKR